MGVSISGSNAISGLGGYDTDFDKVLSQLKQIEKTQLNRLEAWKSDWNLRYQAFTQIIDQVQAASSMLSQLSDKNNFVSKLVQSSNDNVITAVANASAQDVQHTFTVSQVASNAIWANTGHVFDSKTDVINTTGTDQYFSYTYAGEKYDFKVPANTTLESFASMINNSSSNPGIKVSLIQTGNGYVFQVSGKATGASNDLIIHDSNLVGMQATDSTSIWQTNTPLNVSESLTAPTSYVFDLVLQGGATKSVTVKGNATADELVVALNNAAGGITASVDAAGKLTIEGVQSFSRREASDKAYVPVSTRVTVPGNVGDKLNAAGGIAENLGDDEILKFTITLDDGNTREVEIRADATNRDLMAALAQATQSGDGINAGIDSNATWGIALSGVTAVSFDAVSGGTVYAGRLGQKTTDASGVKDTLGASTTSATTLTFSSDKLDSRVDGATDGEGKDLIFTVVKDDGTAVNIGLKGNQTNQEMLDELKTRLTEEGIGFSEDTDADGNPTLKMAGVREFRLSSGGIDSKKQGYSSKLEATTVIEATNASSAPGTTSVGNLFYQDPADGSLLLEKAPDLVYTVTTNDGKTGTLTLASGTSMKDVLLAMRDSDKWDWTDSAGSTSAPANWKVALTDADGNEYLDDSGIPLDPDAIDGPVYLNFSNVQTSTGPGVTGQIAASSNWSIQRAANARYQVDNWPVEMESTSNQIGDVIEGVVFTIQEVGTGRISVSTDITSVEQSIQNFLDAVNSVIYTVNELMKYDETKETTSNDPNDIGNDNYSASGLTNQKGGLLTGNYGVQLFKSRFNSVVTSSPPGFKSMETADNILSGDVLASLSNLGIKTDTDTTSDTYGLLVIAPSSSIAEMQSIDKENYNNMITNNLEAVVDFFCSSGSGASTSTDFRYGSHVEGITKAGNYEVTYTVGTDGKISNVMVGGVPATRDESQPGNYYSVASGDARGLSILIDDLSVGDHPPAGSDPMYVRIKQGLVQTTNNFLKDELVFNDVSISANSSERQVADAVALMSKNGALMSLRNNYKNVMESIDVKIEREQRRLDTWESRQKAIFANLETLLKNYEQQQTQLESQISQLSGNSK